MFIQAFYKDIMKEFLFEETMEGSYDIDIFSYDYGGNEDLKINIVISNAVWRINNTNVSNVLNGEKSNDYVLRKNCPITMTVSGCKDRVMLVMYENDENMMSFSKFIRSNGIIKVGAATSNDIVYNGCGRDALFYISYENGKTFVKPMLRGVYVNNRQISDVTRVRFGDVIFSNMLKVIYLGNIIAVNNPKEKVEVSLEKFTYNYADIRRTSSSDGKKSGDYVFLRSPRIVHKIIEEVIEIDPPTAKAEDRKTPLILSIGPSATMGMGMMVSMGFSVVSRLKTGSWASAIPSMVMACTMMLGAVLWPILNKKYQKKQLIEDEELRIQKYGEYIESMDKKLAEKAKYNRSVYDEIFPSLEVLVQRTLKRERSLWDHTPYDTGFLDIRIGKGVRNSTVETVIAKEKFSLQDDPLKKLASQVQNKYKYLYDVPVSVSLVNEPLVGVVGNRERTMDFAKLITLRVAMTHCYTDVKMAFIYNGKDKNLWSFARWLPHSRVKTDGTRLLADTVSDAGVLLSKIKDIVDERLEPEEGREVRNTNFLPHLILFITDYRMVERNSVLLGLIDRVKDAGVTIIFLYDDIGRLPNQCNTIIQLSDKECSMYNKSDNSGKMQMFLQDISSVADADKIAGVLASVKVDESDEGVSIPERLSFMNMYRAGKIEDLVIEKRWREAQPYKTLEAPLGIGYNNELFSLNIREKFHGPHGLIAGTTGSGKSELIQSLILSIAVNYHPHDVSFVLIDYKGGGMANCFIGMPHVVGTITNLEGNQIKRSLTSLKSELQRRQLLFKEFGVNHIDDYQQKYKKGIASTPMPHLVLISDEFAELKSQEPEFMNDLISTARIGRSLGVHLILATQKPSGVVNDQIWSNTNFRICLKVADTTDSKEMLKRPEAATITLPGRCYVQVGNDEIFTLIQSGYSGAKYVPSDSAEDEEDVNAVACIDLAGNVLYKVKSESKSSGDNETTQLKAIVDYITAYAKREGIEPLNLWEPPLEKVVYLGDIEPSLASFKGSWEPSDGKLAVTVGLYDEPSRQRQGNTVADIGQFGHMAIYGSPGTGKTTFLQTYLTAMARKYSPETINIYIADFGSRSLSYFKTLPHVGDVVYSDDEEKLKKLFKIISTELNTRKRLFAEYGVGNINAYMSASKVSMPAIILVIDNSAAFSELYPQFVDTDLTLLSREGCNYGIYLIVTGVALNSVKRRVAANIDNAFALQLNDVYDYKTLLGDTGGVVPERVKGRGLAKEKNVVEFQTALAVNAEDEAERAALLKAEFAQMAAAYQGKGARSIPVVPDKMKLDILLLNEDYSDIVKSGNIPVGYDVDEAEPIAMDMEKTYVFLVEGAPLSGKTNFIADVIKTVGDREVWLSDNSEGKVKKLCSDIIIDRYASDEGSLNAMVSDLIGEMVNRHKAYKTASEADSGIDKREFTKRFKDIVLCIDDFDTFYSLISDQNANGFGQVLQSASELGLTVFVSGNSSDLSKYKTQPATKTLFKYNVGVTLGNVTSIPILNSNLSPSAKRKTLEPGMGYYVNGSNSTILVKVPYI